MRSLILAGCLALAGCASPQPRYHTLRTMAPDIVRPLPSSGELLVGPSTLPAALDRPQLVIEADGGWRILEQQRWLGGLARSIDETVAGNLSARLKSDRVHAWPQPGPDTRPVRLLIDVKSFVLRTGSEARLTVDWRLVASNNGAMLATGHFTGASRGGDTSSLVDAQSRLLGALSDQIAERLAAHPEWMVSR
ncbi:PqiC family protein [Paludibacterium paludis]|uniref:ABC-type transport auxiliary lipoprotein component domain-containing protein n=1 Tax=Paludibacterium paludis TaxID=1225769 RepID=A0A918U8Z1_9NEIS|nr:PqiC family protein [Paludibacterium paludis]GGY13395.1 hypothetical protein GCM10011289_15870 [Paludibacterium paludis]